MLPGVELARRRRVHYRGDAAAKSSSAGAGDHHHLYAHAYAHHAAGAPAVGVAGPALAARIRLEEKLRGAALPSASPPTSPSSRWSRLMRHNQHQSRQQQQEDDQHHQQAVQVQEQQQQAPYPQQLRPSPPAGDDPASTAATRRRRRAELTRTLSMVDVCAVCLEEVREGRQERVTRLPCSHKYHSDCVLPWLAIQPDCPCCRALVPSAAHATLLVP